MWTKKFKGFEIKRDTPFAYQKEKGWVSPSATNTSSVCTARDRMQLLLKHIGEDPVVPCWVTSQTCYLWWVLQRMKAQWCVTRVTCGTSIVIAPRTTSLWALLQSGGLDRVSL